MEVDTVSGATYSSMGILDAILDALGANYRSVSAGALFADTISSATNGGKSTSSSGGVSVVDTVSSATSGGTTTNVSNPAPEHDQHEDHEVEDD